MNINQECHRKIKEDLILNTQDQTDVQNVVTPNTEKGLGVQQAKHQCKICHKFGHFSSLFYKKGDGLHHHKRCLGSPRAHQLRIRLISTQDSLSRQSKDYSSEEDSFCLYLHVQSTQAETS